MKNLILAAMILSLAAANVYTAKAGDREWAVVGKVLTGVAAATVITHAVAAEPAPVCGSHTFAAPTYGWNFRPPPVVVCRAPVGVVRASIWSAPAPVAGFRSGFGGGYPRFHHHRW